MLQLDLNVCLGSPRGIFKTDENPCLRPRSQLTITLTIYPSISTRSLSLTLAMAEEKASVGNQDNISHCEMTGVKASGEDGTGLDARNIPRYDDPEVKRIMRKVDWRLLPPLTVLYLLSFMDRSNIGNAKVAGMNTDLKLTGPQYNMALTVFFFTYGIFEVLSNIVLKLMRPSWWITILVVSWGTVRGTKSRPLAIDFQLIRCRRSSHFKALLVITIS